MSGQNKSNRLIASNCDLRGCSGSDYCSACKNCSGCAHCNSGGSCGVCKSSSSNNHYSTPKRKKNSARSKPVQYYQYTTSKTYNADEPITIYKELINLREKPNTKSEVLESLLYGDTVIFIEKKGEWSKVKVEKTGTVGFIFSKLLNF